MAGRHRLLSLLPAFIFLFASPGTAHDLPGPSAEWVSPLGRDHVLTGTIWSAQTGRPVTPYALVDALAVSPFVLLGEVHDNADHHRLRAWLVSALASRTAQAANAGRRGPAVVFEHIRVDQQHAVEAFLTSSSERSALALLKAIKWEQSGWPAGELFAPLFDEVLRLRLPILGGNTPQETIRSVAREGLRALPTKERFRLGLEVQLEPLLQKSLLAEIEASHCSLLPKAAYAPMADAQQYRDAHLADILLRAQREHGSAVLMAGNGHVRSDRGVPWHLRQRAPGLRSTVVIFAEVRQGKREADDYLPRDPENAPAADFIWFTPQAQRPDPCEAMRQRSRRESQ